MKLDLYDQRDGLIYLDVLGMSPHDVPEDRNRRHQQPTPAGRRDHDRNRGQQHPARQKQPPPSSRHQRPHPTTPEQQPDRFDRERAMEEDRYERDEADHEVETIEMPRSSAVQPSQLEPAEESASNVLDVEEASEPMGEAPRGMDEEARENGNGGNGSGRRRGRRRRGRRGGRGRPISLPLCPANPSRSTNRMGPNRRPPSRKRPIQTSPLNRRRRRAIRTQSSAKAKRRRAVAAVAAAAAGIVERRTMPQPMVTWTPSQTHRHHQRPSQPRRVRPLSRIAFPRAATPLRMRVPRRRHLRL